MRAQLQYIDGWAAEGRISAPGCRTSYLTGRFKNNASRRADEERRISRAGKKRRISPGGSRTTHLAARVKNTVSHRAVQERRILRVFFS